MFFFSGSKAYELLQKNFKNVYRCTPVSWYENAHGIITSASLINLLFPLPVYDMEKNAFEVKSSNAMETIHRYYDMRKKLHDIAPDVIIADGDINALRLASRWKITAVYIANIIRPSYGFSAFLSPGERIVERYVKQSLRIIIPDNPRPYTISEYNIGNLSSMGLSEKSEYTGAFIDTTPIKGKQEHIYAAISGPIGTRAKLTKNLLPILEKLETKCIVSLGMPGKKIKGKIGNCELHTWLSPEERHNAMKNAKYVIFSGGHATIFETIKYGKPTICSPTQPEQLGNAAKLQDMKCSITAKNQKALEKAIEKIEEEIEVYTSNVAVLSRFSSRFKGLDRAVSIVESLKK